MECFSGFMLGIIVSILWWLFVFSGNTIEYDVRVIPHAQSLCEAHTIEKIYSSRSSGGTPVRYTLHCSNGAVFEFETSNLK